MTVKISSVKSKIYRIFIVNVIITLLFALFLFSFTSCKKDDEFGEIKNPTDADSNTDGNEQSGGNTSDNSGEGVGEHVHELILLAGKAATCTDEGLLECYKCAICDKLYLDSNAEILIQEQTVYPTTEHTLTLHSATVAICERGGCDEYYSCDSCGGLFLDANAQSAISEPPYTAPLVHSPVRIPQIPPTCTTVGYAEYFKCEYCDKSFADASASTEISAPTVIEITSHRIARQEAIAPTCQQAGAYEYYYCIDCGAYFSDEGATQQISAPVIRDALSHTLVEHPAKEPTCTEGGYSQYFICAECDGLFLDADATLSATEPTVLGALPHSPTHKCEIPSSCTATGTGEYYLCEDCQGIFAEAECKTPLTEIPTLALVPHETEYHPTVESTCTASGTMEHYICGICQQLFANSDASVKITGSIALPLKYHTFKNEECISCGARVNLIDYSEYLLAEVGDSVSVRGFVTAINHATDMIYLQYSDYAYKLINARTEGVEVGDMLIATGLKGEDSSIACSYISPCEKEEGDLTPTPYNVTEHLVENIHGTLPLRQYVYVELDALTVLSTIGEEDVLVFANSFDCGEEYDERLIYFSLGADAPITSTDAERIKESYLPMYQVNARGLLYQNGTKLCLIPIDVSFLSNVSVPEDISPQAMLKYEYLAYQFNYAAVPDGSVIKINCNVKEFEEVEIKLVATSENVTINPKGEDGCYTATVTTQEDKLTTVTLSFSIVYGAYESLELFVTYTIDVIK